MNTQDFRDLIEAANRCARVDYPACTSDKEREVWAKIATTYRGKLRFAKEAAMRTKGSAGAAMRRLLPKAKEAHAAISERLDA